MACPYKKEPNLKPDNVVEPTVDGPGEPIPHPPEQWLIGNAGEIDPTFFVSSVWRLADIYGPIYSLKLFGRTVVVVSSHELVDEVCDESRFEKTTKGNLETLRALVGSGLFTAYSDEHVSAHLRPEMFSPFCPTTSDLRTHCGDRNGTSATAS